MKEAIIHPGTKVEIIESPFPTPQPKQIIIKVVYSGSNPKDWKRPEWFHSHLNQGDDISGIVHGVGSDVFEFKPGDRVAALHELGTPGGSYAEYAVSWEHSTLHLPKNVSFEEGATLPLAAMTAVVGLYDRLHLPAPWQPADDGTKIPLVIYGASSAVGSYAIQLAKRSNIHPLICIAGKARQHVEGLIDRSHGDTIIDYRKGDDAVVQGIRDALGGSKLEYAFDCVAEGSSYRNIEQVLEPGIGKITLVLPAQSGLSNVEKSVSMVADVFGDLKDFGHVYFRLLSKELQEGWLKPQPHEVVPGGLAGVEEGLNRLKSGRASAVKYVFKIAATPGVRE